MLDRFNKFYVSAGSISLNHTQSLSNINIVDGIIHPHFTDSGGLLYNDIAVLMLEKPLSWSRTIRPIKIAANQPEHDTECVTSGWGYLSEDQHQISNILQKIKVHIRNPNICKTFYKNEPFYEKSMLCVIGVDTVPCKGDSGGPLVCNHILNGVTSWGISCDISYKLTATVFTSVDHYRDWILLAIYNTHRSANLKSVQIKCEYFFVINILLLFTLYVIF
ncbi:trypsin-like [Lycorma delicatula]|uniref:trypsin-like n=1 Tax=Lycorma delicatula TaxID=130591 RepID=UPI003F51799B